MRTTATPRSGRALARRLMLALALVLASGTLAVAPARAAGLVVTKIADTNDGACDADCSLREAIVAAEATAGADTITFALPGVAPWTITLASSLPPITRPLTIQGPGREVLTIRRGPTSFPLVGVAAPGQEVAISGLTLSGGIAATVYGGNLVSIGGNLSLTDVGLIDGFAEAGLGGAGAYLSNGRIALTRAVVSGNTAPGSRTYGAGAGLYITEYAGPTTVTIADSQIVGNNAGWDGGGIAIVPTSGVAGRTLSVALVNTIVGTAASPNVASEGGGIVAANGTLTLTSSSVTGNRSYSYGGGIYLGNYLSGAGDAALTLTSSSVSGNRSGGDGGGIYAYTVSGGTTVATLTNATIGGNRAERSGGGLALSKGGGGAVSATLTDSTVAGNEAATGDGGGILVENNTRGAAATATLLGSTISGNRAGGGGGGLHVGGLCCVDNGAAATLVNSTISGNRANGAGGGVLVSSGGSGAPPTATLRSTTITGNIADSDDTGGDQGGGLARSGTVELATQSSIVAGNRRGTASPVANDCGGAIASQGHNVWGDQVACPNNAALADRNLAALGLAPDQLLDPALADNGGPTRTHALVPGSPAIDAGDGGSCAAAPPAGAGGIDQRGVARPIGAGCDSGAVEAPPQATLTVAAAGSGDAGRAPAGGGTGPFRYFVGTVVTLTPRPGDGQTFVGWTVDGVYRGWASPLTITMDGPHTVQATFAPSAAFADVPAGRGDAAAIVALAARGTILGYGGGRFGPDDGVQRAQMAALIARAMPAGPGAPPALAASPPCVAGSWDCEAWPNDFTDRGDLVDSLWRDVAALQHYGVAKGYAAADCAAKGLAAPCYAPAAPVSYIETVVFITRAMEAKGYWVAQPAAPQPYAGVPAIFDADVATYAFYTQGAGGVPAPPADWNAGATRGWFARALWQALNAYWGTDGTLPDGRPAGGYVP